MLYHNPQAVVQVNGKCSGSFAIERTVRQGCPLSPPLYVLALELLLRRLRDETAYPALHSILFAGRLSPKVSAYAHDITVFVSRCLDIKAVKRAVARYEQIAGANINFDIGAWRGGQGRCPGCYLVSKAVVLNGQGGGVCRVHLPLDVCLYFLCIRIVVWCNNTPSPNYFVKVLLIFFLFWVNVLFFNLIYGLGSG